MQQALFHIHHRAVFGAINDALEVAVQHQLGGIAHHHGLGHSQLRVDVFCRFGAVFADKAGAAGAEAVDGGIGGAQAGRRDSALEHLRERNAVQPTGVDRTAGAAGVAVVIGAVGAVRGHKGVGDFDVVAAGGAQAEHIKVFNDFEVCLGQQEGAVLQHTRAVFLGQQTTQQNPLAVLRTAAPAPAAAEVVATIHRLGLAGGHVGRCGQRGGVGSPDVNLCLLRKQRDLPVVYANHAINPGGGHAALGQCHLHGVEHARIHFVATPALGLQYLEETCLLHLGDGFTRHHQCVFGGAGALGQARNHGAGALNHFNSFRRQIIVFYGHHGICLRKALLYGLRDIRKENALR